MTVNNRVDIIDGYYVNLIKKWNSRSKIEYDDFLAELKATKDMVEHDMMFRVLADFLVIHGAVTADIITKLVELGYNLNRYQWDGNNLLMILANNQYILAEDLHNGFALKLGFRQNQLDVLSYLIDTGTFDLEQQNDVEERLVHFLAGAPQCNHILERLITTKKVDPNTIARGRLRASDYARSTGNNDGLRVLMEPVLMQ
jgi:ankyrin repeat protein